MRCTCDFLCCCLPGNILVPGRNAPISSLDIPVFQVSRPQDKQFTSNRCVFATSWIRGKRQFCRRKVTTDELTTHSSRACCIRELCIFVIDRYFLSCAAALVSCYTYPPWGVRINTIRNWPYIISLRHIEWLNNRLSVSPCTRSLGVEERLHRWNCIGYTVVRSIPGYKLFCNRAWTECRGVDFGRNPGCSFYNVQRLIWYECFGNLSHRY